MTAIGVLQILLYLVVLVLLVKPLGAFMARVYTGKPCGLDRVLGWLERLIYRVCRIDPAADMSWKTYTAAFLVFNAAGFLVVFLLQLVQDRLPLNPENMPATSWHLAFNTAVSFATNTNWQSYGGETTLSYFTQMLGLTVQNFVSAACGMACLVALIRGFTRKTASGIGNFWFDLVRSTLYILLPLSIVLALVLAASGVVQTFDPYAKAHLIAPTVDASNNPVTEQTIAVGPAASQIAIKQLGTNGGGFFNVNSAHPFENPTPFSNFLETLAILVISAALCSTFGSMVGDKRQGWALLTAMLVIFVPLTFLAYAAEQSGNPRLAASGLDTRAGDLHAGGNMEGKEVRFGIASSALWASATTAASNGSVNCMHDSFTPLGGLIPMWLIQLGEVIFGGVGSGLYGLVVFAIVAVFIAGLMVGRTPEYLGKKIEAFEVKMASLVILAPCFATLLGAAVAVSCDEGRAGVANPGPHGFSEILYAFSSAGNNNGSAFAGLNANTPFWNVALGIAMLIARYACAVPVLAIAGSLAAKKSVPPGAGTLPTHGPLFIALLVGVVIIVGALTFIPGLALGPIVEHLRFAR